MKAKRTSTIVMRPRFDLAPLTMLDPELVVPRSGNDRLATFMLALALVFNDLKGLLLLAESLRGSRPPTDEISGHAGEWRGLDMQLHRLVVALIRELLGLVERFPEQANGTDVREILARAAPKVRKDWNDLLSVATGKGNVTDRAFVTTILQIRNNVAFHYDQPKRLVAGFRSHFFGSPQKPANENAYCSFGPNMERTRFYFADAAVEGALSSIQGSMGSSAFLKHLARVRAAINESLAFILEEYTRPARRRTPARAAGA